MQNSAEMGLYDEHATLKTVEERLKDIYNIDMGDKKLRLKAVTFGDYTYSPDDWTALREAKLKRDTVGRPYYGEFDLLDDKGKVIDHSKLKFGVLPVNTLMDSYLVDGNYYSIPVQFRLKPGAYTRHTDRGDYEVFHNVKNGAPMRTLIDPESKKISIKIRQAAVPIVPILYALGKSDSDISSALGKEITKSNISDQPEKDLSKTYRIIYGSAPKTPDEAVKGVKDYFGGLETTKSVNQNTIGHGTSRVDGDYLLKSTEKLLNVVRGKEEPDNRDDLLYKDVFSVNDILDDSLERMRKTHKLDWMTKRKMQTKDSISSIVNRNNVNKAIKGIFTSSDISRLSDQTNPLANEINHLTTTLLGEGGISSPDLVTMDAKALQPSHTGFLDPAHTPESQSSGITLFLANDTKKEGKKLKTKVINLQTGAYEWLDAETFHHTPVAYPGEYFVSNGRWVPEDNEVVCIYEGHNAVKHPTSVKYAIATPSGLFDLSSNTIPFMQSNQANRLLTSSKMATQASPLAKPELPLVEVFDQGKSVIADIGNKYSVVARAPGTVKEVNNDHIIVSSPSGDIRYAMPLNMPLNSGSFLDSIVKVSPGDKVKKGTVLADTNTTRDGKLATGINMNVAYMPYKGLNYEDAVVITENAAQRLASEHLHRIHIPKESVLDLEKYRAYSPYDIKEDEKDKYDPRGIIAPGTQLSPNDIVAASLQKRTLSLADSLIQRLKKSAVAPFKPNPIIWDRSIPGTVTDVVDVKNGIDVYVKTTEPVLPGDKLVGRHGNKATVSAIIPDSDAPRTESGDPIDIIMDPLTVHPRINMGQMLETAAGKLAKKTGVPYAVENFSGKDYRNDIIDRLKFHGIKEKDNLYDPTLGKTIPDVFNGVQYIHKLKHQVENKISSRGIDEPYNINQQPTQGKGTGGQSIDNLTMNVLLAHNARNFLKDSFSIKNNPNRDYWRAIQNGEIPPAPKVPYEYGKFEAMLKGMGVNTEHIGTSVKLSPFTDTQVRALSAGEITEPYKTFRLKGDDISPDKHGLFGDEVGGTSGNTFNHINLPTRIVAPAYKDAIKAVLGITDAEYDKMLGE